MGKIDSTALQSRRKISFMKGGQGEVSTPLLAEAGLLTPRRKKRDHNIDKGRKGGELYYRQVKKRGEEEVT